MAATPLREMSADTIVISWLRRTYKFRSGIKIKFKSERCITAGSKYLISIEQHFGLMVYANGSTSYPSSMFNILSWDGELKFREIWGNRIYNISDPEFFTKLRKHMTRVLKDKCESFIGTK